MVAAEPEGESVLISDVAADATDEDIVLASREEGHGVLLVGGVIDHGNARSLSESLASLLGRNGALGLNPYGLGVAAQGWHSNTHSRAGGIGMHDLARLVEHLHLLLRVAVVGEDVNLRNDIVSQLVSEFIDGGRTAIEHLAVLLLQFGHGCCTGTAGSLVAGHVDAADMTDTLQGLEAHDHHDGRAVGVGDDATGSVEGILSVALGHHEGNILVHAECGAVVYHHGAVFGDGFGKVLGGAATGADKSYVYSFEVIVVLQQTDRIVLAAEGISASGAAFAAKQYEFVNREIALIEHTQKFLTYGAAGAHDSYFHNDSFCICGAKIHKS